MTARSDRSAAPRLLRILSPLLLAVLGAGVPAATATPQEAAPAAAAPTAAERLQTFEFLVGNWEGNGWAAMGPGGRKEFRQTESVAWDLDGEVLTIHGRGVAVGDDGEERVIHLALGVVIWDPASEGFGMWSYAAGHGQGWRAFEPLADGQQGFAWAQTVPGGTIRYRMHLDTEGRWIEEGHFHAADAPADAPGTPILRFQLSRR